RWAWAYRKEDGLLAHTNNGLERQNRVFKHKFLTDRSSYSVSGMISALITEYLTSRKKQYIMANVKADAGFGRSYKEVVPEYLWNRPPYFIDHCLKRMQSAQALSANDVKRTGPHTFQV
ncbi:uncharacterized protein LOC117115951, partial [Anneissia japonica]|uniref:uncharacterized protein LOC117115951 n=1 Tax=Anneissia japonica TaxID=1529436 RepID=UPI001425A4DF